jgi:hypothetical protein
VPLPACCVVALRASLQVAALALAGDYGNVPAGGPAVAQRDHAGAGPVLTTAAPDSPASAAATELSTDPGYPSAERAFEAAFIGSGLGLRGYFENREYASAIYRMPDGRWRFVAPVAGGSMTSSIPYGSVPAAAVSIVGAHTHGQPRIPGDRDGLYGTDFSVLDRRAALTNFTNSRGRIAAQLLLTSCFTILRLGFEQRYDPGQQRIVVATQRSVVAEPPEDPWDRGLLPHSIPDVALTGGGAAPAGVTAAAAAAPVAARERR